MPQMGELDSKPALRHVCTRCRRAVLPAAFAQTCTRAPPAGVGGDGPALGGRRAVTEVDRLSVCGSYKYGRREAEAARSTLLYGFVFSYAPLFSVIHITARDCTRRRASHYPGVLVPLTLGFVRHGPCETLCSWRLKYVCALVRFFYCCLA